MAQLPTRLVIKMIMESPKLSLSACLCLYLAVGTACNAADSIAITPPVEARVALIIGNSDYDESGAYTKRENTPVNRLPDLKNPCNDAELIAAKLIILGWSETNIIQRCNSTKREMLQAIEDFSLIYMSKSPAFGFVYYAGHGVQIEDDTYMFGVDTLVDIDSSVNIYKNFKKANLFKGGVRIRQEVLSSIGTGGAGSLLLVLDACRENPLFPALRAKNIQMISGPRKGEPIPGIKHLFSTANGRLASDGIAGNSPFASVFAEEMKNGRSVSTIIEHVVTKLYEQTLDTDLPQIPDEVGSFRPPPPKTCFGSCGG